MRILCVLMLLCSVWYTTAYAETYIAGQVGTTVSAKAADNEITDPLFPAGTTAGNLDLKSSVVYGGKIGYYFESLKWAGVEVEAFTATPDVKAQGVAVTAPGVGPLSLQQPQLDVRVTTLAFNALARYPGDVLQPYAGVGLGVFFASIGNNQSDTAPGLNALAGLRMKVTQQVGLFAEYKYNRAAFSFEPSRTALGLDTTYQAHHVVFGVGYHF